MEPPRHDLIRLAAHHLGKCGVGEQDAAVMRDGKYGNRNPLQGDQRGQLLHGGHRRLAVFPVSSSSAGRLGTTCSHRAVVSMASLGQHGPGSAVDLVCINVRDLVGVVGICATPFRCFLGTAWSLHGGNFAGGDGMCARVLRYLFFWHAALCTTCFARCTTCLAREVPGSRLNPLTARPVARLFAPYLACDLLPHGPCGESRAAVEILRRWSRCRACAESLWPQIVSGTSP